MNWLANLFGTRNIPRTTRRARLSVEMLEDRQLMAGGLAASINTSVLVQDPTGGWIDQNIHGSALHSLVCQLDADHVMSRTDMMAVFNQVEQQTNAVVGLTGDDRADLQALVTHPAILGMPDYVDNLATKIVNGTHSMQVSQSPTGNGVQTAPGSSAGMIENLVSKWFKGTERPAITEPGIQYAKAGGTLFGASGLPAYTDVHQGSIGDCWLMASYEEAARQTPSLVKSMFKDNGDDTFTVRFYNYGVPDYVTVDKYLPKNGTGYLVYAHSCSGNDPYAAASNKLWVGLAEKAYAQFNNNISYATLNNGGFSQRPMNQITGRDTWAVNLSTSPVGVWYAGTDTGVMSEHAMAAKASQAFAAGQLVTVGTPQSPPTLVPAHMYAVLQVTQSGGKYQFMLGNPWGEAGIYHSVSYPAFVWLNEHDLFKNLDYLAFTKGTGPMAVTSNAATMTDIVPKFAEVQVAAPTAMATFAVASTPKSVQPLAPLVHTVTSTKSSKPSAAASSATSAKKTAGKFGDLKVDTKVVKGSGEATTATAIRG